MKAICVTGTPGTGKTELAKALARKLGHDYIDVNKVIGGHKLVEGYDRVRKCNIVDEKKLARVLVSIIRKRKGVVIDSHLSHYVPSKHVDLCIVTECDLKVLKERLEKRKYPKAKIRENLDAEIFGLCHNEAVENFHKVLLVDTTKKSVSSIVKGIVPALS